MAKLFFKATSWRVLKKLLLTTGTGTFFILNVSWNWGCISHGPQEALLNASCELRLNSGHFGQQPLHNTLLEKYKIIQSVNRWPRQNAEEAVGCAKLADTTHYMVLQPWHIGKWGIWWGALKHWLEWQNAPKAPASPNEAAWCRTRSTGRRKDQMSLVLSLFPSSTACIHRAAHLLLSSSVNI